MENLRVPEPKQACEAQSLPSINHATPKIRNTKPHTTQKDTKNLVKPLNRNPKHEASESPLTAPMHTTHLSLGFRVQVEVDHPSQHEGAQLPCQPFNRKKV